MKLKSLNFLLFLFLIIQLIGCSHSKKNNLPFTSFRFLISSEELAKYECDPPDYILITCDAIFCAKKLSSTIVKFSKDFVPLKKYCHIGQGPGEFDGFFSIAKQGGNILIFTHNKIVVLDNELNFVKEIKRDVIIRSFYPFYSKERYYFAKISDPWNVIVCDKDFNVLKKMKIENKIPFNSTSPLDKVFFYTFYPLIGKYVISAGTFIDNENCEFKIFNVESLQFEKTYRWENNEFHTSEKDYKLRRNLLLFGGVIELNDYYLLRVNFVKKLKDFRRNTIEGMVVFDKKTGKVVFKKYKVPFTILTHVYDYTGENKVFVYKENKGIYSCKLEL